MVRNYSCLATQPRTLSDNKWRDIGRRSSLLLLFALILFFIAPTPLLLAQAPIEAEVEFFIVADDPLQSFTVGDQIVFRLEITHPSDSRVVLPQLEEQWEAFSVIDQTAPQTIDNGDGTATTGKEIVVSLFQPGEYQTPSIIVTHRKADGSIEELATPVIVVNIASILVEGDRDLRDLKPQADLPEPVIWPWILAAVVVGMLLLALLAALLVWLRYRRQQAEEMISVPVAVVDTRPPDVIAHAELDRIQAMRLPAHNQIKEHYALVSLCIRRYIEGRYHLPALEQTSTELARAFRSSRLPANEIRDLMSIINESDFVKFARYRPDEEAVYDLIGHVRQVIDITTAAAKAREKPAPPANGAGSAAKTPLTNGSISASESTPETPQNTEEDA